MAITYEYLIQTIQSTDIKVVESKLRNFWKLGFFIEGGIHTHSKVVKILPPKIVTEYTVFMRKTIKIESDDEKD
jgi:hypothetical protein